MQTTEIQELTESNAEVLVVHFHSDVSANSAVVPKALSPPDVQEHLWQALWLCLWHTSVPGTTSSRDVFP